MRLVHSALLAFALVPLGCATYLDDLNRADAHAANNKHEQALALFRADEPDLDSLSHADQTRYFYLRGMNDYRMGKDFRPDARHWLALARAHDQQMAGGLTQEWKDRLEEALKDLNQDVYGAGVVPETPGREGAKSDKGDEDSSAKPSDEDQGETESKPKKRKKKAAED